MSEGNGSKASQIILNAILIVVATLTSAFLMWAGSKVFDLNGRQENIVAVQKTQAEAILRVVEGHRRLRKKMDDFSQRVFAIEANLKPIEISELRRLFSSVSQRIDCLERKVDGEQVRC